MSHHNLRFELFFEFERNAYDNEHTCRTECVCHSDILAESVESECGHYCDEREEECAEQRYTAVYLSEVFARRFTRSYALDSSAVLLQVDRNVNGVELDLRVEVSEEYDEQEGEDVVYRRACAQVLSIEAYYAVVLREEGQYHLREQHERRCEDDRHNAASVDLHGNVGGLTAVHFVTFDLLCVVDFDPAFAAVDEYDEQEHYENQQQISEDKPDMVGFVTYCLESSYERRCKRGYDTDEDYHRRTVADSVFGDSFAEPHYERGACGEQKYDDRAADCFAAQSLLDSAGVVEGYDDTDTLYDCERDCYVSRDLGYLCAAFVTLLAHSLERRNDKSQKLHYNEAVDKRQNAQSKQRTASKRTARNNVHYL